MSSAALTKESSGSGVREFPAIRELEFLRSCCPAQHRGAATPHSPPWQETDWNRLLRLADQHGLVPLLYQEADSSFFPATALAQLRRMFDANARQALWLTAELLRILDALDSEGMDALPYKGPVLAELLYGNVAQRQFSDLDILIHAKDALRAKRALQPLGYSAGPELSPRQEEAYLAAGYEYAFDSTRGRNLLEIQWKILPRFYSIDFDLEGLFRRAAPINLGDRQIRSLSAEDLLLVLCVHAAKHVWIQLSWLRDIVSLVRSRSLDWDFINRQARLLGIERILQVSFCLAERVFETRLPSVPSHYFSPRRETVQIVDEVIGLIVSDTDYDTESIPYFRLMMRLRERQRHRLQFLGRLVFTPSVGEWRAVNLPQMLFPLYGVVRLARLARRLRSTA